MRLPLRVSTTPELQSALENIAYRPVPKWLGTFTFRYYGRAYGAVHRGLPEPVLQETVRLANACKPRQSWTTVFVQRYEPGQNVRPHRDPANNIGFTVIGLYGSFSTTRLRVGREWFEQSPGDVFMLPCTINGKRGPEHEMQWVEPGSGIRYAIILNTLV